MRFLLAAAALALSLTSTPVAGAEASPSQLSAPGVRYHTLSKLLHRFRREAEARARVLAVR